MARRYRAGKVKAMSLEGVEKAVQKLREKGEQVVEAAKLAIKKGANTIYEDAKSRCPVDTGKLRDSLKNTAVAEGAAYEITANAKNSKGVPYGKFVEFGVNGKPFFYPAFDAHVDEIKDDVKNAIQGAVGKVKLWKPAS